MQTVQALERRLAFVAQLANDRGLLIRSITYSIWLSKASRLRSSLDNEGAQILSAKPYYSLLINPGRLLFPTHQN
jgi:hypothetical protein